MRKGGLAALRQYEWVETTIVSVKGEEKSRTQNSCYYRADGKVQKTQISAAPEDSGRKKRGVRGRIVESKSDVAAQNLAVAIENSGYKKLGG